MKADHQLVARVARDFLERDEGGQFRLRPGGPRAVAVAVEISERLGTLPASIDELLRLCIRLERARSVDAAKMLEAAAAGTTAVRRLLGVRSAINLVPHLQRRRLKLLDQPRALGRMQVRDLLPPSSPRSRPTGPALLRR